MAEVDELVKLYRAAARQLARVLRGANSTRRLHVVGQLRELAAIMDRLEPATARWIRRTIAAEYARGLREADKALSQGKQAPLVTGGFTGIDTRAVRALEGRISRDLAATRGAITSGLALGDPRNFGAKLVEEALRKDGRVALVNGEAKVRVPSGKLWDLEAYSKMLSLTATADARRVANRERYLANGVDVVKVIHTGTKHAVCAAWEGERLSLTGATPGLPTVADARAAGLFHPNCRHRYVVDTSAGQPDVPVGPRAVPAPEVPRPTLGLSARVPAPDVPRPTPRG